MPTYLCHGFRWKRRSIRVYVVVQDLDDAAPEWIIRTGSARNFVESFYRLFPFLPECTFPVIRAGSKASGRSRSSTTPSVDRLSIADSSAGDDNASTNSGSRGQNRPAAAARESSNSGRKRTSPPEPLLRGNNPTTNPAAAAPSSSSSSLSSSAASQQLLLSRLGDPVLSQDWSPVKLLEEHDPANLDEVSRPYAYVADYAARIDASCSIVEEIQRYESRVRHSRNPAVTGPSSDEMLCKRRDGRSGSRSGGGSSGGGGSGSRGAKTGWFEQLRDQLQQDEEIRWYVVVNGDEERAWVLERRASSIATRPQSTVSVTTPTPASFAQQQQQQLQQQQQQRPLAEDEEADLETRRALLRQELGFKSGGVEELRERVIERRPVAAQKDLSPLDVPASAEPPESPQQRTPRTPGKGGFKRLFLRSKTDEPAT